jgi:hypothetical protein
MPCHLMSKSNEHKQCTKGTPSHFIQFIQSTSSLLNSYPSNTSPHTRSNPHSTRIPPHTQNNNTASQDTPLDTRDPSSASAGAPAGTAVPGAVRSTFAAGAGVRHIAWGHLVRTGAGVGRSCSF